MLIPQLIPGRFLAWDIYPEHNSYIISNDGRGNSEWHWPTCLGVALSMAGALASAYSRGKANGFDLGFDKCWDSMAGRPGDDSRY